MLLSMLVCIWIHLKIHLALVEGCKLDALSNALPSCSPINGRLTVPMTPSFEDLSSILFQTHLLSHLSRQSKPLCCNLSVGIMLSRRCAVQNIGILWHQIGSFQTILDASVFLFAQDAECFFCCSCDVFCRQPISLRGQRHGTLHCRLLSGALPVVVFIKCTFQAFLPNEIMRIILSVPCKLSFAKLLNDPAFFKHVGGVCSIQFCFGHLLQSFGNVAFMLAQSRTSQKRQ